jgi:hypothetical protein
LIIRSTSTSLFLQAVDLTAINNRSERIKPTDLTVVRTVRSKDAHRDGENTVRTDDRSDGILLKPAARLLRTWLIAKSLRKCALS